LHTHDLRRPNTQGHTTVLRMLSDRPDELVRQRTQALNRLRVLIAALAPGTHRGKLSPVAVAATQVLHGLHPTAPADRTELLLAGDLLAEVDAATRPRVPAWHRTSPSSTARSSEEHQVPLPTAGSVRRPARLAYPHLITGLHVR
jgi:hypothetical protein